MKTKIMKTKLLIIIILCFTINSIAQNETLNGNLLFPIDNGTARINATDNYGNLSFGVGGNNDNLFINWDGKIGVGTIIPSAKLNIINSSTIDWNNLGNSGLLIGSSSNGLGIDTNEIVTKGGDLYVGTITSGKNLYFRAGSAINRMVINGYSGDIGIGTDSPNAKLEVKLPHVGFLDEEIRIGSYYQNKFGGLGLNYRIDGPGSTSRHLVTYRGNNRTTVMSFKNGDIGIGTSSPQAKLHIKNSDNTYGAILANANENNFSLYTKTISTQPAYTESFRLGLKHGINENNGYISFYRGGSASGGFLGFSTNGLERIRIHKDGNIGIGTTLNSNPNNYKLAVNGIIGSKEIKVETTSTTWPDFVFEKDYNLPTLREVENQIKEKGHLKNIPSAKEVEKNGIFLGEMNAKLLQKIEELTLYTIQQQKEIERLKNELKNNKKLDLRISKLESLISKTK